MPHSSRPWSAVALTATAAVGCLAATLLITVLPFVRFAYRAPALHVVLETANSLIALLVGLLVYGRYRRSGHASELLLVCSLAVVAVANLALTAIPTALELSGRGAVTSWAPLVVRLVASLLLLGAAFTPGHLRLRSQRTAPVVLFLALFVTLMAVLALLVGEGLPPPVDPGEVPSEAGWPTVTGHPVAMGVQAGSFFLYSAAAVAFTRRAERTGDELLRWVGAACVLAAFARVNYLLFPSLYSDYVYAGDLLRFGYYLMLLVGAYREIRGYWAAQAEAAVLEDRRRLARDLHDGLTQELSYIWSQTRKLAATSADRDTVERLNGAAARALDEARSAIAALTRTTSGSFHDVLAATTDGLSSRYDADVVLEVDESVLVAPAVADGILRIVSEAFRNAVLHGGAGTVKVELSGRPLQLTICDDGTGFDPRTSKNPPGFGLTSMRERAEGLGAQFSITSTPGEGAIVRVDWREGSAA